MATRKSDPASFVEREWKVFFERVEPSRLRRGKAAFKQGVVQQIRISQNGWVDAKVKLGGYGSGGTVQVRIPCIDWWERFHSDVALWLSRRPDWLGNLLSGIWDMEFIDFLQSAGLHIFPDAKSAERVQSESLCTCNDWEKPCQHVVAVLYRMIAEMTNDLMRAFEYVGLDRTALLDETHRHTARWVREEMQSTGSEFHVIASNTHEAVDSGHVEGALWSEEEVLLRRTEEPLNQPKSLQIETKMNPKRIQVLEELLGYTAGK